MESLFYMRAQRGATSAERHSTHARAPRHLGYNRGRARVEARRRHPMALETPQPRVRPVTGTHVVRVQHDTLEFQPATV